MSRFRIEPPLGLPERPRFATCPKRRAELRDEFLRRLDYVLASFRLGREMTDFNASLARLKRTVERGRQARARGDRVHPAIEIAINLHARRFAHERTGDAGAPLTPEDVKKAAAWVASTVKPIRGRPRLALLDHHVAGLMALIQQFTGTAVLASRSSGTDRYTPRLIGAARVLLHLREIDSTITETSLVGKVLKVRRTYAGRPLRFRDFYPLYGATLNADCEPVLTPPFRLEHFERTVPIYCP